VEKNIQAGAKYLRWIVDESYKDEPMTKVDNQRLPAALIVTASHTESGIRYGSGAEARS
jgi:hypothetical protein